MTLLPTSIPTNFSTAATNGAQNNTNCKLDIEEWIFTVTPVYILIITVLGIVLNVFVLLVFCLHKRPCTVAEIYLSNLAAADVVLMACLPFWAVNVSKRFNWPFGWPLCKLINVGINMNVYCSIYFLVLVSIDRYVALVHALSHSRMRRPKYAKLSCLLVWGFGLLLSAPTYIYRDVKTECNDTSCYFNYPSTTVRLIFEVMLAMFSFIIPISIIAYCTLKIIQALNNRVIVGLNGQRREHKSTTLVLAVLLAFLICWVPFHLTRIVENLTRNKALTIKSSVFSSCQIILTYLAFFNSVLNPILYVIVGKNFRTKVKEVLTVRKRRESFSMTTSVRSTLMRSTKSVNESR